MAQTRNEARLLGATALALVVLLSLTYLASVTGMLQRLLQPEWSPMQAVIFFVFSALPLLLWTILLVTLWLSEDKSPSRSLFCSALVAWLLLQAVLILPQLVFLVPEPPQWIAGLASSLWNWTLPIGTLWPLLLAYGLRRSPRFRPVAGIVALTWAWANFAVDVGRFLAIRLIGPESAAVEAFGSASEYVLPLLVIAALVLIGQSVAVHRVEPATR